MTPNGWKRLALLCLLAPGVVAAQSDALLQAFRNYETAKSAQQAPQALAYGEEAARLTEADGGDKRDLVQLLCELGEFAAQRGYDERATAYYARALKLQEADVGIVHPDLVPTLTALADLALKGKRYAEAEAALQRIVDIERAAYGDQHQNVIATLVKLRDIYRAANDAGGVAAIDSQLTSAPPGRKLWGVKDGVAVDSKRYALKNGFASVRVFYGTNRAQTSETKPALLYGRIPGPLQYGYVDVTIPQTHKLAELETAKQWSEYTLQVTNTDMRTQFVLLDEVKPLPKDDFVRRLQREIQSSPSKDVFVFVHGYNNSFEDTARRAAQLAYDLDFDGTPIMYSWPSQGSLTGYFADEDMVAASGPRLAEFLGTLETQSGAGRIHLIAHSMGNRVLLAALKCCMPVRMGDAAHPNAFGQIIFTAPDVDRDAFMSEFPSLRGSAERLTLYASDSDVALRMSRYYHHVPRAGSAGALIVRLQGLDTIDMSGLPADALGHSYFAANGGAVYDFTAPSVARRCAGLTAALQHRRGQSRKSHHRGLAVRCRQMPG